MKTESTIPPEASSRLPLAWRVALSVILLVHLLAVFMAPFTFATSTGPGLGSPFAQPVLAALRPYLDIAFLDHGYFFFAPNPGPSHLLRAKLEFADGRPPVEWMFPDRQRQWPRLLYHRHFMLAEQLHAEFVPPEPPPGLAEDPQQRASWQRARSVYELRRKAFENHLRQTYGAERVTLTRVEHALLGPAEFAAERQPLTAPETYLDLSESPPPVPPSAGSPPVPPLGPLLPPGSSRIPLVAPTPDGSGGS